MKDEKNNPMWPACQDHGCLFTKPNGQGTNSRCRCIDNSPHKVRFAVRAMTKELATLRAENEELKKDNDYAENNEAKAWVKVAKLRAALEDARDEYILIAQTDAKDSAGNDFSDRIKKRLPEILEALRGKNDQN